MFFFLLAHKPYNNKPLTFGLANSMIHRASAKQMFFRHAIATSGSNCPTELLLRGRVRLAFILNSIATCVQCWQNSFAAGRESRERLLAVAADAVLLAYVLPTATAQAGYKTSERSNMFAVTQHSLRRYYTAVIQN